MGLRWLPIIIATLLSTIIVMAVLLGGSIGQGGWRGQSVEYTVSILKSIHTITITEDQPEQIITQQTTSSSETSILPPSSPSSSSSSTTSTTTATMPTPTTTTTQKQMANDGDYESSKITLMGTLNGTGTFSRVRYRFDNVLLETEDLLSVHLPASVPLPNGPLIVDGVHGAPPFMQVNTTPPTAIHHRDIIQKQEHYLNISYHRIEIFQQDEHLRKEPLRKCSRWETRPVYVMYVPHPYNVWHVWNDALMGAYQTLREEGHLPLALIHEDGSMEEYTEGLDEECHWTMDLYGNGTSYQPKNCLPRRGRLPKPPTNFASSKGSPVKCSPAFDDWCRPGVVAFNRGSGPIILMAKNTTWPDRKWQHMLTALSEDIREWDDMVGTCFKELYIGKSHTLDFYTGLFLSYPSYPEAQKQRVGAMQAFQELMATAERHHRDVKHEMRPNSDSEEWEGYNNPDLEILRQGIGPENIGALSVLRDIRTAGISQEKLEPREIEEINRMRREETEDMLQFAKGKQQAQEEEELRSSGSGARKRPGIKPPTDAVYTQFVPTPSAPRPVVTFMWRMSFKRCAANEADILTYILLRYNVTVRVTTFNEPLMETMDLMNSTDVLIGMHGAGWTNALFLKRGAAALQLHPYGWKNPVSKIPIRGGAYKAIAKAKETLYVEWVNPFAKYSFFRAADFKSMEKRGTPVPFKYSLHPDPDVKLPYALGTNIGSQWIYQNTLVSIRDLAVKLDKMMALKGIKPLRVLGPEVVSVSEAAAAAELNF